MIKYPMLQKNHRYIDSDVLSWLKLHFPSADIDHGRVFIGHHNKNGNGLYNLSRRNINELEDFVPRMHISRNLDYYITANTMKGVIRGNDQIFSLLNIVADIDCHDDHEGCSPELLQQYLWRCSRDLWTQGIIPMPNSANSTGRGVQLWWAINPVSIADLHSYCRIRDFILDSLWGVIDENPEQFESLKIDFRASKNIAGWFRFPNTYNTKANKWGSVRILNHERYELQALLDQYVPEDYRPRGSVGPKKASAALLTDCDIEMFRDGKTALARRAYQLAQLRALRNSVVGSETRDLYCFILYCSLLGEFGCDEATRRTLLFNQGFKEPLPEKELMQALSSAKEKQYRITNKWIIQALGITDEEQAAIGIVDASDVTPQHRKQNRTRDELRKAVKDKRNNEILKLFDQGLNKSEIGRKLGIARNTVIKVIQEREDTIAPIVCAECTCEEPQKQRIVNGEEPSKCADNKVLKNGAYKYVSYGATAKSSTETMEQHELARYIIDFIWGQLRRKCVQLE